MTLRRLKNICLLCLTILIFILGMYCININVRADDDDDYSYYNDYDDYDYSYYDDYDYDYYDDYIYSGSGVVYANEENGYEVIIDDEADLLSPIEEKKLLKTMKKITKWGNAAFKSIDSNPYDSTSQYAYEYYHEQFYNDSGTLFLIDMDERNIWIFSDGTIYKTITESYADTITDNVYKLASAQDYYGCSNKAFSQIYTLLSGHKIAQPMKYISNAFLSIILALIINYFIVKVTSSAHKATAGQVLRNMVCHCNVQERGIKFTHQTRTYSPKSSGGSGGGGGGGHSGGGGGHSF